MLKSIITVALGGLVFIHRTRRVGSRVSNECLFIESEISYSRWW